jgi:hypothetical protein
MSKDNLVCTHIFGHNLLNITGPVLMGVMLALTINRQKKADLILQTPIYPSGGEEDHRQYIPTECDNYGWSICLYKRSMSALIN